MSYDEKIVEAIEDGKIVRVPESYARRESLPILRRSAVEEMSKNPQQVQEKNKRMQSDYKVDIMEKLKKKTSWKEKQVLSELLENFNWIIKTERRKKGLTRKQVAQMISESEDNIKMLEYGTLPTDDFVLINKMQKFYGVNLRKDGKDFSQSAQDLMRKTSERNAQFKVPSKKDAPEEKISGDEIQIIDDEDF